MNGKCTACRFYDGKSCAVTKTRTTPHYTCAYWASNTASAGNKCKDCRFYDGSNCSVRNARTQALYTCGYWAAFR